MALKLFVDDLRNPSDSIDGNWIVYRPQKEGDMKVFYFMVKHADIISLDHDFGMLDQDGKDILTGYDVICRLEMLAYNNEIWTSRLPILLCHSDNGPGKDRIEATIEAIYRRKGKERPIVLDL